MPKNELPSSPLELLVLVLVLVLLALLPSPPLPLPPTKMTMIIMIPSILPKPSHSPRRKPLLPSMAWLLCLLSVLPLVELAKPSTSSAQPTVHLPLLMLQKMPRMMLRTMTKQRRTVRRMLRSLLTLYIKIRITKDCVLS